QDLLISRPVRPISRTLAARWWMLLSAVYLTACASPSGPVPLVITSHTPVKATASQLREGVAQIVKDWSDAKARIEDIHTRRVVEMMAIEADMAFLEEAAKIDPQQTAAGLDAGRLERLLDLKAPKQTFEQELEQALAPPRPPQEIVRYFRSVWPAAQETFTTDETARVLELWNRLKDLTGAPIQSGADMANWLVAEKLASW